MESLNCSLDLKGCSIKIKARGCGHFGAYSNMKPLCCKVDMKEEEFTYVGENGLLTLELEGECSFKEIEVFY